MSEVLGDLERILYVNDELDCGPGAPFWRSLIHLGKHVEEVRELVKLADHEAIIVKDKL